MINDLISFDQQLLLLLNGSESCYWDGIWMAITQPLTWVLFYLCLLYIFVRSYNIKQVFFVLLAVALAILLADQVASGVCKPYFHRFRPTHEPLLAGQVDVVDGYVGGLYGFMSSHAANGFAICTVVSLVVRHRWVTFTMFLYAPLTSFSRIYLGLHYPGDILCGGLWGIISGIIAYRFYRWLVQRYVPSRRFYSTTSTSTGILREEAAVPISAFFFTLLCVFVYAIFYAAKH